MNNGYFAVVLDKNSCKEVRLGANFDVVIMENAMTSSGWNSNLPVQQKYPWKFWDIYCLRTLSNVLDKRLPKANNHNALDDARAEAELLIDILKS